MVVRQCSYLQHARPQRSASQHLSCSCSCRAWPNLHLLSAGCSCHLCCLPWICQELPFAACLQLPFGCLLSPALSCLSDCLLQAGRSTPPCTGASPEVLQPYAQLPQARAQDHILLLLLLVRLKAAPKVVATWQVPSPSAPQGGTLPWLLGRAGVMGGIWLQVRM